MFIKVPKTPLPQKIPGYAPALLQLLVGAYRGVFRTWSNIYKGAFLRKNLIALSCYLFSRKRSVADVRLGCRGLAKGLNLLFQAYKLSRENTQPEKMCDIVFEKSKMWDSKQNVC